MSSIPIKGSFFPNLIKKWKYMYFSLIITIHVMQRMSLCALIVMLLWPLDSCLLKFFLKNYCALQIGIFIEKTKQNNPSLLYCFDLITRGPSPHHSPEKQFQTTNIFAQSYDYTITLIIRDKKPINISFLRIEWSLFKKKKKKKKNF